MDLSFLGARFQSSHILQSKRLSTNPPVPALYLMDHDPHSAAETFKNETITSVTASMIFLVWSSENSPSKTLISKYLLIVRYKYHYYRY